MEIQELYKYREELIELSKDDTGFINESSVIEQVIPFMLDAKLIDNEDFTETYYNSEMDGSQLKINGYIVNDSKERLQIFIVNENAISITRNNIEISNKEQYETIFKRAVNFANKAIKGHLNEIQDIGAINALINQLSSVLGSEQFDVFEIFLITTSITTNGNVQNLQTKRMDFKDEKIKIKYSKQNISYEKEILILKKLVDINYLYEVLISQGNREALLINFEEQFDFKIETIKAADEKNFESYLCVMPAEILAELYKRYSSRLLEKNVRSFLQFRGVNLGMRKTLIKDPEKFIAYNNGLTITASNKEFVTINNKLYIKSLSDFQIVNGGQTTASIYFSKKDGIDISKVKVMAKINVAKDVSEEELNELISNISEYSNSQSKVTTVDLRSRNPQLNKIKALSDSVITPSGRKWFFEKSKGEFNTKLRIAGKSGKNRLEKEYPKEYRFTKEQLGKYYSAWGNEPYKVKKGGEAIFRNFLEKIYIYENEKKYKIDRNFYEDLVSKIILFKALEIIHGVRNDAIGQLRSVVVPYTIAVIFTYTEGNKKNNNTFDFSKLWLKEDLEEDLKIYFKDLMILLNELIKIYSKSDDLGEYSKKKELWDDIITSNEITNFLNSSDSTLIFNKYAISKKEFEKKLKLKRLEVDFKSLKENIEIHMKTDNFYSKLNMLLWDDLSENEMNKLSNIISKIKEKKNIESELINFENNFIVNIRANKPNIFDEINIEEKTILNITYNNILKIYNRAIEQNLDVVSEFKKIENIARAKDVKFYSVFSEIGRILNAGEVIEIKHIYSACHYYE
jgi:hypothetical protein